MFFGTGSPNWRSISKQEVELIVFLRMCSDKITKNGEKIPSKCCFKAQVPRIYMFFGTESPNLRSISKPEVELMVFLRMRTAQ